MGKFGAVLQPRFDGDALGAVRLPLLTKSSQDQGVAFGNRSVRLRLRPWFAVRLALGLERQSEWLTCAPELGRPSSARPVFAGMGSRGLTSSGLSNSRLIEDPRLAVSPHFPMGESPSTSGGFGGGGGLAQYLRGPAGGPISATAQDRFGRLELALPGDSTPCTRN